MTSISLVLITKNEERCLDRCLSSFKAFVDEIVVLDTGSTDTTIDIAKVHGARVGQFDWCDDFSAARNASLLQVRTDLSLIVDADEWLFKSSPFLNFRSQSKTISAMRIKRRNYFDLDKSQECMDEWITRILPQGARYEGIIHEQPILNGPVEKADLMIAHDGYLRKFRGPKTTRNLYLLKKILNTDPNDGYYSYQLAKEYENNSNFKEASVWYERSLKLTHLNLAFRHDLVVRSIFSFAKAGEFQVVEKLINDGEWLQSPDFHFAAGGALLDYAIQDTKRAFTLLPRIEAHWLRCLEIGEVDDLSNTVRGRGSFLAAHNLAIFYSSLGDIDKYEFYKKMEVSLRNAFR